MTPYVTIVILGIATGAISLLLTKATVFNFLHDWLEKNIPFVGAILNCTWCTSHWVAIFFTLVYQPLLLTKSNRLAWQSTWLDYALTPVDFLVTIMLIVTFASVSARMIYSVYKPLMENYE